LISTRRRRRRRRRLGFEVEVGVIGVAATNKLGFHLWSRSVAPRKAVHSLRWVLL
jgi:hypothetical protein